MRVIFQHNARWPGQGMPIHHHVAGDDQTGPALGPGSIEPNQGRSGRMLGVRQVFLHGGLGQAIGNDAAVGQVQGLKQIAHR